MSGSSCTGALDVPTFQVGEDLLQPIDLRPADEQDMTSLDLLCSLIVVHG
jgi:hypothetical protein